MKQCKACQKLIFAESDGLCCTCWGERESKPKLGRPVTKTPEERKAKHDKWFSDNKESRREYHRNYGRIRRAKKARFVVEYMGSFRLMPGDDAGSWGEFAYAKIFQSIPRAEYSVNKLGKGVVMVYKETAAETIAEYNNKKEGE
tara:strand:- start:936 stop:1367 length:432 start_codon:yes stop_codon:yes gene_type:complete